MIIKRDKYLNKLINGIKNDQIKVITSIRRCGKSYLISKLFYEFLLTQGITDNQIIYFALEDLIKFICCNIRKEVVAFDLWSFKH